MFKEVSSRMGTFFQSAWKGGMESINALEMKRKELIVLAIYFFAVLLSCLHVPFAPFIVGLISGIYFASWVKSQSKQLIDLVFPLNFQSFLLLGLALSIFFTIPSLFLGLLTALGVLAIIA